MMACEIFETIDRRSTANTGRYPIIGWCKTHDRPANACFEVAVAVQAEREACALVADAFGYHMEKEAFDKGSDAEMEAKISAAQHIATLIRGRAET